MSLIQMTPKARKIFEQSMLGAISNVISTMNNLGIPATPSAAMERDNRCNQLVISATFYFGSNPSVRNTIRSTVGRWERDNKHAVRDPEELRAALGIQHMTQWNKFLLYWFQKTGVVREYRFPYWEAKKPDVRETEERLERMRRNQPEPVAAAAAEGITPVVDEGISPAPSNDAFDRALKAAEEALKERDQAERERDEAKKALAEAKKGGPVEIIIKKDGKKPVVIKTAHFKLPELMVRVKEGIHTYLVGPAGSGKTTAAEQIAQGLALPFGFMSVGPQTTKTDILGYMNATGKYVTTEFRKRFEEGGIFLFDEIDAGNPGVLTCINAALANGWAAFPDGMVKRSDEFRCIAAGNTFGTGPDRQYVGRQEMDAASIDRFNFLEWPYDEGLEMAICKAINETIAAEWVPQVQRIRAAVSKLSIRHVVSPRTSINGVKLLAAGVDKESVLATQLWKSLKPAEITRVTAALT